MTASLRSATQAGLRRPPAAEPPDAPTVPPRNQAGGPPESAATLMATGAELALVGVTIAAALGLSRLFAGGEWMAPVLIAAVAGHAVAWGCRRAGLGLLPSAIASGVGLVLAVVWLVEAHTTTLLIPRGATWGAIGDDLRAAWERFGEVKAPTPPLRGFVLAAVAGVWLTASTSDFFAFRMRARFEAMAPGFTLFVFGAILGADRLRLPTTALYLAALLGFVLWSEAARQSRAGSWFAGRVREGDAAMLRNGAGLAAVAVLVAVMIGPNLPGAGSAGLVSWRDNEEGSSRSRITVSPLVDIRGRLVEQSNVELFTVRADAPNYWRLTSLDRFDGTIWSSLGTYQPARSTLPGAREGRTLTQEFAIGPLGTIWLPAAYRPERVNGVRGARFDRDSGSLLAQDETVDNLSYVVTSTIPELTQAQLAQASGDMPPDVAERYLPLPEDFPPDIRDRALGVVAGATTPYDKARRLQDFFRINGGFSYDLNVPAGHGEDAMRQFLFVSKRGYCEQFAGTYAAMARAVGLPARVAVGFVQGEVQVDGRYHVLGRDAHAWPEVYIAGYGWVAFEPTPGRNAPGTAGYTGLNQVNDPPLTDPSTVTTTPTTVSGNTPPSTGDPQEELETDLGSAAPQEDATNPVVRALLVLGLLAALYAVAVPVAHRWLRQRRRRAATTPSDHVLVAWEEAVDALSLAGHPRRSHETPGEYAARSAKASVVRESAPDLSRLAEETTAAGFSVNGVPPEAVPPAQQASARVSGELRAQAGTAQRMKWALDPRPVVEGWRRRD